MRAVVLQKFMVGNLLYQRGLQLDLPMEQYEALFQAGRVGPAAGPDVPAKPAPPRKRANPKSQQLARALRLRGELETTDLEPGA